MRDSATVTRVIDAIGFAPAAPILDPSLASGAASEMESVRDACRRMIDVVAQDAETLVFLYEPQSHNVVQWLIAHHSDITDRRQVVLLPTRGTSELGTTVASLKDLSSQTPTGLIAVGDGSACRSLKAPGYLDDRSFDFDSGVATALASADAASLRNLDLDLAEELLVAGRHVWPVVGELLRDDDRTWSGNLLENTDLYGVSYFVAYWVASHA